MCGVRWTNIGDKIKKDNGALLFFMSLLFLFYGATKLNQLLFATPLVY